MSTSAWTALALTWTSGLAAQQELLPDCPVPLEVSGVSPPQVIRQDQRNVLVYELTLANPVSQSYWIESLEIRSPAGVVLWTIAGSEWANVALGLPPAPELSVAPEIETDDGMQRGPTADAKAWERGLELAGGRRFILYLWLTCEGNDPPKHLEHHFAIKSHTGDIRWEVEGPVLQVHPPSLIIDAPVRGGVWYVSNGFANDTGHRRFFSAVGELRIPQRFGADYLKLDSEGGNAAPDGSLLENFHSYDVPLHAVADGKIVSVVDGMPDRAAGQAPGRMSWEETPGNHVILEIEPDVFAAYVHLRPGSIQVRIGESVARGDMIGAIGNSGNTSAPHMHFHMMDRPHVNNSQGIPFAFRSFELVVDDYRFRPDQRPLPEVGRRIENSTPRLRWVIRFPE